MALLNAILLGTESNKAVQAANIMSKLEYHFKGGNLSM